MTLKYGAVDQHWQVFPGKSLLWHEADEGWLCFDSSDGQTRLLSDLAHLLMCSLTAQTQPVLNEAQLLELAQAQDAQLSPIEALQALQATVSALVDAELLVALAP